MKNQFEGFLGQRKAEIVSAALRLADQVGITGITTKRLAHEVGVVEGALYRHIKTKFDIFNIILDISDRLIDQKFKENERRKVAPDEALRDFFVFAVDFLEGSPGLYLLLFSDALYVENKPLLRQFKMFIISLIGRFEAVIRRGIRTKVFRADLNPHTFAILYLGVIQTSFTMWNILEARAKSYRKIALPLFEEFLNSMRPVKPAKKGSNHD
jgi:TetR/AcrR family transcriptional regulator